MEWDIKYVRIRIREGAHERVLIPVTIAEFSIERVYKLDRFYIATNTNSKFPPISVSPIKLPVCLGESKRRVDSAR